MNSSAQQVPPPRPKLSRSEWFKRLFPDRTPNLWCPPLTHYDRAGAIDEARIQAHLRFIAPWVKGLLVPGSTGDGWELTAQESHRVLDVALGAARELHLRVLVGALRPVAADASQAIRQTAERLQAATGGLPALEWLSGTPVCGFAVCPPRGPEVSQPEMESALADLLQLGLPLALYQLPQVTQNEMSPALVRSLAERFSNFILFKDTSGRDVVALSGESLGGVFLARGMEGEYARWLKAGGGPYDGFLLSAANCFASQLHDVRRKLEEGRTAEAATLSEKVSAVIARVFALAKDIPDGNVFANGNKALDHFFAHGPEAARVPPPRLHSGRALPVELIRAAGGLLTEHGFMPARGYLE